MPTRRHNFWNTFIWFEYFSKRHVSVHLQVGIIVQNTEICSKTLHIYMINIHVDADVLTDDFFMQNFHEYFYMVYTRNGRDTIYLL